MLGKPAPPPGGGLEAVVIGGGLAGLCVALELAARGAGVLVLEPGRAGSASPAAAGMLAPSVERSRGPAHHFAIAARDHYPGFLERIATETGRSVPTAHRGVLQLASGSAAEALKQDLPTGSEWMAAADVAALEPALSRCDGAALHPLDGAVDNVRLLEAVRALLHLLPRVRVERIAATALDLTGDQPAVHTEHGDRITADRVVLASGAWASQLDGLPRSLPIEPVRGQMLSYADVPVHRVTYGAEGYIVPRGGETLAGSTMEHAGFDGDVTQAGVAALREIAAGIAPVLGTVREGRSWAGLRPATPDLQPILGTDPQHPALLYACGYSRNGILLAPLAALCLAQLTVGEEPAHDLAPFAVGRFVSEQ